MGRGSGFDATAGQVRGASFAGRVRIAEGAPNAPRWRRLASLWGDVTEPHQRQAHAIWDLRRANDIAEGDRPDTEFVLVRRHEEPYVDVIEAQSKLARENRHAAWARLADAHAERRVAEEGGEVPGSSADGASMGFDHDAAPGDVAAAPGAVAAAPGTAIAAPGEVEGAPRIPYEMMNTTNERARYEQDQAERARAEQRSKERRLQRAPGVPKAPIPDAHKPLFDPEHQHSGAGGIPGAPQSLVGKRVRAFHDGEVCEGVAMMEYPVEGLVDLLVDILGGGQAQRLTVGLDDILMDDLDADDAGDAGDKPGDAREESKSDDADDDKEKEAAPDPDSANGDFAMTASGADFTEQIREGAARALAEQAGTARGGQVSPPESYVEADRLISEFEARTGEAISDAFRQAAKDEGVEPDWYEAGQFGRALAEYRTAQVEGDDESVEDDDLDGEDDGFSVESQAQAATHVALIGRVAFNADAGSIEYEAGSLFRIESGIDETTLTLIAEATSVQHQLKRQALDELVARGHAEEVAL